MRKFQEVIRFVLAGIAVFGVLGAVTTFGDITPSAVEYILAGLFMGFCFGAPIGLFVWMVYRMFRVAVTDVATAQPRRDAFRP